ncbi:MAG: transglutaminase domain-containing protein [Erysipelotrichaceae bacterium]|nr:transglutaminase domain-containing protein [Erysipelotrichaceae bacterium]
MMAGEFAAASTDALDYIGKVYKYVCENVKYDKEKAETVKSGYLPKPDETLKTGKGICFDYASLTASMLRSQGIPTKVIFGYVSPDDLYHAWNMFYTKETGWVSVEFKVNEKEWTRMDLTFSANGSDQKFIGDGSNYADVYQY